jgi:hypothetical protein
VIQPYHHHARVANMAMTKEEALSAIMEQMSEVLFYFHQEEGDTEEQLDDTESNMQDIVEIVANSLSMEVVSVDDKKITITVELQDSIEFIENLLS